MKTIQNLLEEMKTEKERKEELFSLVPEILNGEKIYYKDNNFIIMKNSELFSGNDNYKIENKVVGAFPYIFFLAGIYENLKKGF